MGSSVMAIEKKLAAASEPRRPKRGGVNSLFRVWTSCSWTKHWSSCLLGVERTFVSSQPA